MSNEFSRRCPRCNKEIIVLRICGNWKEMNVDYSRHRCGVGAGGIKIYSPEEKAEFQLQREIPDNELVDKLAVARTLIK